MAGCGARLIASAHSRVRSGRVGCFEVAAEEPMCEDHPEHRAATGTLGHFMELAPQTASTDQEQFIVGNIGPRDAENAFFAPAICAGVY